jgi:signal transduction histidine kinase/DNA-binding response OmpR family regulator/CHASE3 domain sensor protein
MKSLLKKNIFIGFGLSLLLLIITSTASFISISNLLNSQKMVIHTNEVIKKLESTVAIVLAAEASQRGFLLTGNREFLQPYNGSRERALRALDEIKILVNDNIVQQKDAEELKQVITERFRLLQILIDIKRNGNDPTVEELRKGKIYMDQARRLVTQMEDREQGLLTIRTQAMNKFVSSTPTFLLVASLLSILLTVIAFLKVNADLEKRIRLQDELEEKDKDINHRISVIENIADKISAGNYKIRAEDAGKDSLGSLAYSLNKMAASLDESFEELSQKEWLQTGAAGLNEKIIGEKDLTTLTRDIINFVTEYSGSQAGAFYLAGNDGRLQLVSSYALMKESQKAFLQPGEGLAGQAAASGKMTQVTGLATEDYTMSFISGNIRPRSVIAIPVLFYRSVKGVIELASIEEYSGQAKLFFEMVSHNAGVAISTAQNRNRVQELLEETQSQSEELQAQHAELESANSELEIHAEKLQASEEELRVQQEELQQANQELEERSRLLEEKNELILERNLQIQAKAEDLAVSTRYKSEFLANMSHELRTPLNSILLLSRLLSENHGNSLSKDQLEYASVIQSSGNGLLTLIDEILDLSKIESGKMELEYSDVNLEAIGSDLTSMFEPMAREKNIEFRVEALHNGAGMIETDKLRLQQILRNLISNALKFTRHGSVILTIEKDEQKISFSVKDTGIGIPEEKQQTIFEAFQQADGSTRRQYGGTGLGLSISRELAKLLGGEIRLVSEEGKGSEFTLILPVHKATVLKEKQKTARLLPDSITDIQNPVELPVDKSFISEKIPQSIPDDRDNISKKDKVILIVEDDTAFARSLLDYTRKIGYKGVVAVRGDEAVSLAKEFLPFGILLDIQLPVKSGWEVMDDLKSDPTTRPIPVHMMSAHEAKTKSLSKGAVDFISKPVAFEKLGEVFRKIEQALNNHPKKVLIVEENSKHAKALSYFLQSYNVPSQIKNTVGEGIEAIHENEVDCVILDVGIDARSSFEILENLKKEPGLEHLPIIVFTGKNLSHLEEMKIKQYADSIVIKTAHSYQRILDEVSLFLHLVEDNKKGKKPLKYKKLGELNEVLKGKNVLVADDDVRNIFSLTKALESYGVNVVSAMDGVEALKQVEANGNIDLVLMDMMMPELDGYESTRKIREIPKYRNLPIIAVTAKAMAGDREKCISAGASDYIIKPVDVDQLISLLRVWLYE